MKIIKASDLQFVPASHEDPKNPGVLKKVLVQAAEAIDGHLQMINWALLPKDSSFQLHYHETLQEIFIMLNGPVIITVDQQSFELQKGDGFIVDIGEQHEMKNISGGDVEYLVVGVSNGSGQTIIVT